MERKIVVETFVVLEIQEKIKHRLSLRNLKRAERLECYFYVSCDSSITILGTNDCRVFHCDEKRYQLNNYFKTREAAEKVAEQIREIFKNSKAE